MQLRIDARKRRTWPVCVTTRFSRIDCPALLLVLCPDPVVAAWCAKPIDSGSVVVTPFVLGRVRFRSSQMSARLGETPS